MLNGKTALITGSSRGIGRGIAVKFAQQGAFVGINYVSNDSAAKKTLRLVKETGGNGILLKGDVSVKKDVENIVRKLIGERGNVNILVNNAGVYIRNNFDEIKYKTWDNIISVNLTGCYHVCKKIIPYMNSNDKIIFVSSQLAFKGSSHGADYAASKAGMLGLMRSLALNLADKGIYVNAVAPGTIDTDIISNYTPEMRRKRIEKIPLGRLGIPEDVANVCLFLASDLSNYVTGETINVNGGLYIH